MQVTGSDAPERPQGGTPQPPSPNDAVQRETWTEGLRNKLTKLLLSPRVGEEGGGGGGKQLVGERLSRGSEKISSPNAVDGVVTPGEESQQGTANASSSPVATLVQNTPRKASSVLEGEGEDVRGAEECVPPDVASSYREDREDVPDTTTRSLARLSAVEPQHLRSPFDSRDVSYETQIEDTNAGEGEDQEGGEEEEGGYDRGGGEEEEQEAKAADYGEEEEDDGDGHQDSNTAWEAAGGQEVENEGEDYHLPEESGTEESSVQTSILQRETAGAGINRVVTVEDTAWAWEDTEVVASRGGSGSYERARKTPPSPPPRRIVKTPAAPSKTSATRDAMKAVVQRAETPQKTQKKSKKPAR